MDDFPWPEQFLEVPKQLLPCITEHLAKCKMEIDDSDTFACWAEKMSLLIYMYDPVESERSFETQFEGVKNEIIRMIDEAIAKNATTFGSLKLRTADKCYENSYFKYYFEIFYA